MDRAGCKVLTILLTVVLICGLFPIQALALGPRGSLQIATSSVVVKGMWGTCPWEITSDGTLTVHPGVGSREGGYPWIEYKKKIRHVVFASEGGAKVIAPEYCDGLLALSWFEDGDEHMSWSTDGVGFTGINYYA